jgi:hypothetical protein
MIGFEGPEILWSMAQAASQASAFISASPLFAHKSPSSLELEGQGRPQGVIGLEGGELHHNGMHWRALLI